MARRVNRGLAAAIGLGLVVVAVGAILVARLGHLGSPAAAHATGAAAAATASSGPAPTPGPSASSPTGFGAPTPTPAPTLVPDPLTGLPVTPAQAELHPIAVMIDDHDLARPQSGFNSAAVVWQAPAEGGIPRYMLIFQSTIPTSVGPIRSARQYYIEWAAEWRAMYVHHGGSSQALATLRVDGRGQLVWNADGFRWLGSYLWRVTDRVAPHNVYTDGAHLRALAARLDVPDGPIQPHWAFGPGTAAPRPTGNSLTVIYPYESIVFRYDPTRNAYLRYIEGSKRPQVDAADGQVVAPANVVLLRMHFGPLYPNDPHRRLEASDVGHGDAWISTGGMTIHGTWRKASVTAPTLLFDGAGNPVTLTAGQTFVEVIPLNYAYRIVQGRAPAAVSRTVDGANAPA